MSKCFGNGSPRVGEPLETLTRSKIVDMVPTQATVPDCTKGFLDKMLLCSSDKASEAALYLLPQEEAELVAPGLTEELPMCPQGSWLGSKQCSRRPERQQAENSISGDTLLKSAQVLDLHYRTQSVPFIFSCDLQLSIS